MNNFKTDINGGLPLVLDDFRWIDEGYRKAFYGIMSSFGVTDQETFILSGCVRSVSTGTVSITEGYVSIGGEVCYVPAHSYAEPTGTDVEYWVVDVSFDSDGTKTFQNSSINDTYEVRSAVINVAASVPPGNTSYEDTKTIHQIIEEKLPRDTWHTIGTQTVGPTTYLIECYKDIDGFVHLRGHNYQEDFNDEVVDILVATLPVGYRPDVKKRYGIFSYWSSGTVGNNFIEVNTDGEIRIVIADVGASDAIEFSQITPFQAV